nr:MAG TPA: hypothetical protein [Caudoviricetes sp.]DAM63469.1 MAG TPA: hypothetical protein [Caudoviricetes sp.]DAY53077.1 MAG TPA: hypothetical protein [Caudoviricetes sp.]
MLAMRLCALSVLAIAILINFRGKRDDRYIISGIYMIISWLIMIYSKL